MIGRHKCVDCGRMSPETHGEITLTTSFGWRIRRAPPPAEEGTTEWRCPVCWQKLKAQQQTPSSPPGSGGDPKR
jgi:hypothetical protein